VLATTEGPCATAVTPARLSRALDDAARLAGPARVVTVLPRTGSGVALAHPALSCGVRLQQTAGGGSASDLYLALRPVQAADPDAYVVVLRADHDPVFPATFAESAY